VLHLVHWMVNCLVPWMELRKVSKMEGLKEIEMELDWVFVKEQDLVLVSGQHSA